MNSNIEHDQAVNCGEDRMDDENAAKKSGFNLREVVLFSYIGESAEGGKQSTDLVESFHQRLIEKVMCHKG